MFKFQIRQVLRRGNTVIPDIFEAPYIKLLSNSPNFIDAIVFVSAGIFLCGKSLLGFHCPGINDFHPSCGYTANNVLVVNGMEAIPPFLKWVQRKNHKTFSGILVLDEVVAGDLLGEFQFVDGHEVGKIVLRGVVEA